MCVGFFFSTQSFLAHGVRFDLVRKSPLIMPNCAFYVIGGELKACMPALTAENYDLLVQHFCKPANKETGVRTSCPRM